MKCSVSWRSSWGVCRLTALCGVLFFFLVGVGTGCQQRKSWKKLSAKKVENLLCDLYFAEGMLAVANFDEVPDTVRVMLYNDIYKRHGATQEDLDSTLFYMSASQIKLLIEVVSKAEKRIEKFQTDYLAKRVEMATPGSVWLTQWEEQFREKSKFLLATGPILLYPSSTFSPQSYTFNIPYEEHEPAMLQLRGHLSGLQRNKASLSFLLSVEFPQKDADPKVLQQEFFTTTDGVFTLLLPVSQLSKDSHAVLTLHLHQVSHAANTPPVELSYPELALLPAPLTDEQLLILVDKHLKRPRI